jgi:hypothetical protein
MSNQPHADISCIHYKITSGEAFAICDKAHKDRQATLAAVDALATRVGAVKGRSVTMGNRVQGLYFRTNPDKKVWKTVKGCPGYFEPRTASEDGKKLAEELKAMNLPTAEDLAKALGCEMFFRDLSGNHYVAAVGSSLRDGAYYLEAATRIKKELLDGNEQISRGVYYLAVDGK